MSAPSISVVIPTYNGGERPRRCLKAVFAQTVPPAEVIVVDDGSTEPLAWLAEEAARRPSLQVLRQENAGPAAARNRGWRAASGEVVAFTDDDCLPTPSWLAELGAAFAEQPEAPAVYGRIIATGERSPLAHYVENDGGEHQTANAAFRREVLERLGGFDEAFRYPYLEDTELFYRLSELGEPAFAAGAVVEHPVRPGTLRGRLRRVDYYAADYLLYAKHPERYRARRNGCRPLVHLLYYLGLKHGLATALREFPWLFRRPLEYLTLLAALILERALLAWRLLTGRLQRSAREAGAR